MNRDGNLTEVTSLISCSNGAHISAANDIFRSRKRSSTTAVSLQYGDGSLIQCQNFSVVELCVHYEAPLVVLTRNFSICTPKPLTSIF